MPQDVLRGDFDTHPGVGGDEVFHLIEALTGKVGDGLHAFTAVIVAAVEAHHVKRAHRAEGARMADRLKGWAVRLCHRRILAARSCP